MPHTAAMDEELEAELREQFLAAGMDEDSADELIGVIGEEMLWPES